MQYWIFKANPETYDIDRRLQDPAAEMVWPVTRYHERIQPGDTVFLWRGAAPRGICAILTITDFPCQPRSAEIQDGFNLQPDQTPESAPHWAKCRIDRRFAVIEMSVIKKIPGLELFSFFSAFQQAVNFSIHRPEGTILMRFIDQYLAAAPLTPPPTPARVPAARQTAARRPAGSAPSARKPAEPVKKQTAVSLLKCEECGKFVISTETERHVREAHAGQPVEWLKTK